LLKILSRRIKDNITFDLLKEIIHSYTSIPRQKVGMPIGNLTSQILANIYLNELDRFVKHKLKPQAYLRYGDDFILIDQDLQKLESSRALATEFLENTLKLKVNPKSDIIMKAENGLKFLGVWIWPTGKTLTQRNYARIKSRLTIRNASSYRGLINNHASKKHKKHFSWQISELI
jgi:hypothetical protein